ncbi:MAG: hypothetical protein IJP71_00325 [Lachnospiraceae bacterium]|nr:hypothetical protein [Lachnospiraceae bacterium]
MKKKILALAVASILGVSSIAFNSFAEGVNNQVGQERQMGERPERPENEIFGKITAISENSVTISLAEMKKPEDGQGGFRPERNNQNENIDATGNQNGFKPEERKELTEEQKAEMKKKMEEMFTLTGETKTIDISKADFNAFGRGPKDGNKLQGAAINSNDNVKESQKVEKTYKDYQVGDYISIELESAGSNTAKTVRDAFMMRGMGPRGGQGMPPQGNATLN